MRLYAFLIAAVLFASPGARAAEPVRLILDTDIGNDIDDTLALAMIHALESRGEVQLLAVTITKDNRYAAPFVNLVNTFYNRPDIPIGVVHHGKTPDASDMLQKPATRLNSAGRSVYPHQLRDGSQAPEAVQLLRRVLEEQPDHSVTIAQIGFSTNLARLLQSSGGRALVSRKVRLLSLMAGSFSKSQPEYNIYTDADSAAILLRDWPTPMVFSGFEIGVAITFPYESIQKDFGYTDNHPIREAYLAFVKNKPEDRANYDSTAVLEAIRPDRGYFDLSKPGRVSLGPKQVTVFTEDPQGRCRFLVLKPEQVPRIRQLMTDLVSEPPQPGHSAPSGQR